MPATSRRTLYWTVIFTAIDLIGAPQYDADEYPDDWPNPEPATALAPQVGFTHTAPGFQ